MFFLYFSVIEDAEGYSKFEAIYNEYHAMLFKIALGITKNPHDAEDVMQNSLFAIAKDIKNIKTDNVNMLKSYLYKIVKNNALDFLRKKKSKSFGLLDDFELIQSNESTTHSIESDEQYIRLVILIKKMPTTYRDVLILHYLHEMPVARIATVLNRKKSTIKQQLIRGTKLLRKCLQEMGFHD